MLFKENTVGGRPPGLSLFGATLRQAQDDANREICFADYVNLKDLWFLHDAVG